jgi:hypothetical protein
MGQFESIKFQPQRPLLRELSADRLNTILQEIRRNKPKGERGITVRQSGDGTYIGLAAAIPVGGAGASATRQPWDIYVESTEGEDDNITYTLKVQPGTLNGTLASNWDSEFTAQDDTLYFGKARCETDGVSVIGVQIVIEDSPPAIQEPQKFSVPSSVDILFGLFKDGTSRNLIGGNGQIDAIPNVALAVQPEIAPNPGELPVDLFYYLAR